MGRRACALQQVGRTVFMVIALRGHPLEVGFQRILAWCVASSVFAVAGGLAHGNARALLWLGAVCIDLLGGIVGFYTPGLGRRALRTGPSRAATSPSAARRSC